MIRIEHLTKTYSSSQGNITALQDVSLEVPEGAVFGIIGLSGAGKSTLIRCINMLEKPTAGHVFINDLDMTTLSTNDLRKTRQTIGMIFQHFHLLESRTVTGNIAFPLEIAGWPKSKIVNRVAELLPLVGLEDKALVYPSQLSGGQKQRVGIARALATNPSILLCDEATSALDPQTTVSILQLLKEINEKLRLTVVLITHEMKVIKEICTHVAVIDHSQIVEQGTIESVFLNPRSETAKQFVSSIFPSALPASLLHTLAMSSGSLLLRVNFLGTTASEAIVSELIRCCDISANILYGSIDYIRSNLFGTLTLELLGSPENLAKAQTFLAERRLGVEVLRP